MQDSIRYVQCPYSYVDQPEKKQKSSPYELLSSKLFERDHEFSDKNFQKARRVSNQENILDSFSRIGRCLNHVGRNEIPKEGLDKVCLILMNNFQNEEYDKYNPQIGPMNDGYLVGLIHHRLEFKIFYLHNCKQGSYPKWLQFFLSNTKIDLTVFYSGHNKNGIEFKDNKFVSKDQLSKLINENEECKCNTLFISDCSEGGSVFEINNDNKNKKMISLSIKKSDFLTSKESKRSHGIFTYYLCKYIYDQPNITPKRLSELVEPSIERFKSHVICETTNDKLHDQPIFE